MAISFSAVGTFAAADNASVTPTLPSFSAGDLLLCFASARGTGTLACSGWTQKYQDAHSSGGNNTIALFYKVAAGGDANPTVTYSGGAAGHTVIAECVAISGSAGAAAFIQRGAVSSNVTTQNIGAIAGITGVLINNAVLVLGHKADDWTSIATLTGDSQTWNELSDAAKSTAGNDAGIVWDYCIASSNNLSISNKTFTVTGGGVNTGMGYIIEIGIASNTGFKDTATRFRLRVQKFVDTATRFRLRVQKYKDTSMRFRLAGPQAYKDTATRFRLIGQSFKNTGLRFRLRATKFVDTATRFRLQVRNYVDTNVLFKLRVGAYRDTATRFRLGNQRFIDTATRFVLIVPNDSFVDTLTRFRLRAQVFGNTATRFKLDVREYADTHVLFKLRVGGHRDTATRFRLYGSRIRDTQVRFCLQLDPTSAGLVDTRMDITARRVGV